MLYNLHCNCNGSPPVPTPPGVAGFFGKRFWPLKKLGLFWVCFFEAGADFLERAILAGGIQLIERILEPVVRRLGQCSTEALERDAERGESITQSLKRPEAANEDESENDSERRQHYAPLSYGGQSQR